MILSSDINGFKMNIFVFIVLVGGMMEECFSGLVQVRDSKNKEDCYAQEKIYDNYTNKCYKLLTKGPCPKGQWFVLEKPKSSPLNNDQMRIEAKCVEEECSEGEYLWSETKSCVKPRDKNKLCRYPETEELRYNVFGEAECFCSNLPPRARLHGDKDNPCYELYTQGPCRSGLVFGFDASDGPSCIPDPCYYESRHRKIMGTLSSDSVLVPWTNNVCYELGTRGPCPEGLTFKVHLQLHVPSCVSFKNAIFHFNTDCFRDENGICQKEIGAKGTKYKRGIVGALRAYRIRKNSNRKRKPLSIVIDEKK